MAKRISNFVHLIAPLPTLACVAILGFSSEAHADSLPQVTAVVPGFRADATTTAGGEVLFDRLLPASTSFELRVLAPATGAIGGVVEVWPSRDCGAPHGAKQYYKLRMTASGQDAERVLRAELPPLQVDQPYCIKFDLKRSPTDNELDRAASTAANDLLAELLARRDDCYSNATGKARFVDALRRGATVAGFRGNLEEAASLALREFVQTGTVACDALTGELGKQSNLSTQAASGSKEAQSALLENIATVSRQTDAVRASLLAAFKSGAVREAAAVALDFRIATENPGKGKTPAAANYASVDAGVALAFPSGSNAQRAWVLPYLGLNLSWVPVDRTIALTDLAGNWALNRFSLTIGMTLSEPSLKGRTTKSVLLNNYPVAALGFRLTHYTRVTAGAVFYWLDAANPASNAIELHAAPFIGASLDIDLIHMLTQAKL